MVAIIRNRRVVDDLGYSRYPLGMLVGLASVIMLFTALSSAYIVRAAAANDWVTLPMPPTLWMSTLLILMSSVTLEAARRALKQATGFVYQRWLTATVLLGAGFLFSQLIVWRQLVGQGVYIATNPHSSFFYLLTATHAFHLAGGLAALLYLLIRHPLHLPDNFALARRVAITDAVAIYWHFMDALWIYLFLLLFLWR